jgi:hypothetical protein
MLPGKIFIPGSKKFREVAEEKLRGIQKKEKSWEEEVIPVMTGTV